MNARSFPTFCAWGRFLRRWTRRFLRRLRLLFFSRKSLTVYLIVFSLGSLAWFTDRWHGRRAWAAEKERLTAAGETLDLKVLLPQRPPDGENFCAIPQLAPLREDVSRPGSALSSDRLFMWYGKDTVEKRTKQGKTYRAKVPLPNPGGDASLADICTAFRKAGILPAQPLAATPAEELMLSAAEWENLLTALDDAAHRPAAILIPAPVERSEIGMHGGLHRAFRLVKSLTLHGLAAVETRNTAAAHRDLRIIARLADAAENERSVIGLLVAEAIRRNGHQVIRAGIRIHQWSAQEVADFMKTTSENTLVDAWHAAMLTERASSCRMLEHPAELKDVIGGKGALQILQNLYWRCAPEGPGLRYCASISRFYSRVASAMGTTATNETWLSRIRKIEEEGYPSVFGNSFVEGTARMYGMPLFSRRLLHGACLLEQYFLKNGRYPATLDAVPATSPETFRDVDGQPLHYRTTPEGTNFRLWSVGWDGKDDSTKSGTGGKGEDWVFSTEP